MQLRYPETLISIIVIALDRPPHQECEYPCRDNDYEHGGLGNVPLAHRFLAFSQMLAQPTKENASIASHIQRSEFIRALSFIRFVCLQFSKWHLAERLSIFPETFRALLVRLSTTARNDVSCWRVFPALSGWTRVARIV